MAQVAITHFTRAIQENLFQGLDWIQKSVSHDAFSDGKTVEIPISGSEPTVEEDRSSFPITVTERTDDKRSYDLIKFDAGAILVPEDDVRTLSYNKAQSILREHVGAIQQRIGLRGLYNWSPNEAARVFTSTGSTIAQNPSASVSTRKAVTIEDLAKVSARLAKDNAYKPGKMWALFPADMYYSMLSDNPEIISREYMNTANLPSGVISQIYGFNIILTAETIRYDASNEKIAIGTAIENTDDWSALFWNEDFVCRALGTIKVFHNANDATYQGDIYSAYVRFNATQMRNSGVGTAVIIQG